MKRPGPRESEQRTISRVFTSFNNLLKRVEGGVGLMCQILVSIKKLHNYINEGL